MIWTDSYTDYVPCIFYSSHLQDLKEITHDFLYENYRTEKLSRTVNGGDQEDASLNAEDMATQSVRLKEEQLRKEEEKVCHVNLMFYIIGYISNCIHYLFNSSVKLN